MFARQALTLAHISHGSLEIGLGTGLVSDPSYAMIGIDDWGAPAALIRAKASFMGLWVYREDHTEVRVLGSLIEKQLTTPEYYPLTLNALRLACNQATNRDPVVEYDEPTIRAASVCLQRRGELLREDLRRHRRLAMRRQQHAGRRSEVAHPGMVVCERRIADYRQRQRQIAGKSMRRGRDGGACRQKQLLHAGLLRLDLVDRPRGRYLNF